MFGPSTSEVSLRAAGKSRGGFFHADGQLGAQVLGFCSFALRLMESRIYMTPMKNHPGKSPMRKHPILGHVQMKPGHFRLGNLCNRTSHVQPAF